MAQEEKFVYVFEEGRADMKYVLGGKGANLAGRSTTLLLVNVRSGAPFSMPGMMDAVLSLSLNDNQPFPATRSWADMNAMPVCPDVWQTTLRTKAQLREAAVQTG